MQFEFIIVPAKQFLLTIANPLLLTGVIYYILRPGVRFLTERSIPKYMAILSIYLVISISGFLIINYLGPIFVSQFNELRSLVSDDFGLWREKTTQIIAKYNYDFLPIEQFVDNIPTYIKNVVRYLTHNLTSFAKTVTSIAAIIVLLPILLFYFLRDSEKFAQKTLQKVPTQYKEQVRLVLTKVDKVLYHYIIGRSLAAVVVGVLIFVGYLLIGIEYAFALSTFAMLTAIVPILGPIVGVLPALAVGVLQSPLMALKVLGVLVVAQQLEGSFITPQLLGAQLDMHPVTVIMLLLAAGSLWGLLGILLIIPLYGVCAVVVREFWCNC